MIYLFDVAPGKACKVAKKPGNPAICEMRDFFWKSHKDQLVGRIVLKGHPTDRLSNTMNANDN